MEPAGRDFTESLGESLGKSEDSSELTEEQTDEILNALRDAQTAMERVRELDERYCLTYHLAYRMPATRADEYRQAFKTYMENREQL